MMPVSGRVLFVWPPSVPTYFNAGHRLPLWEVAAYMRRELPDLVVDAVDAGVLNYNWKEMADVLAAQYDVVAVVNEYDNGDGVRRLLAYIQAISPRTKVVTYGRVSGVIPRFFCQYQLDGIVQNGDFEAGIRGFVELVLGRRPAELARGLLLRDGVDWVATPQGGLVEPRDWAFPAVAELPLDAYARLSSRHENRFSALPGKRELSVAVARGCPIGCAYCLVPAYQGLRERRRPVSDVVSHIRDSREQAAFDYVSMYAPTFTLDRPWVRALCAEIQSLGVPWKCCTSMHHLDATLIGAMAASGCVRISVGLETLDAPSKASLPRIKQVDDHAVCNVAKWCSEAGVELNCFVMLGMPEQSLAGLKHTFEVVRRAGAKLRPTVYTPYHQLADTISEADLVTFFTRQVAQDMAVDGLTQEEFYAMALGADLSP